MPYVIARVQLRYGSEQLGPFAELLTEGLIPALGASGVRFRGALQTQIGSLYEVHDIWEVEDAEHFGRARARVRELPEYHPILARAAELIESETLTYTDTLPGTPPL